MRKMNGEPLKPSIKLGAKQVSNPVIKIYTIREVYPLKIWIDGAAMVDIIIITL